jgi:hypothetical protein
LEAAIPIKALSVIDPVLNAVGGLSRILSSTDGPVGNVQYFQSYYQENEEESSILISLDDTNFYNGDIAHRGSFKGSTVGEDGVPLSIWGVNQWNVNTMWAGFRSPNNRIYWVLNDDLEYDYYYGALVGADVNHSTIVFYVYSYVQEDLLFAGVLP